MVAMPRYPAIAEQVVADYRDGVPSKAIAARHQISIDTVYALARQANVDRPRIDTRTPAPAPAGSFAEHLRLLRTSRRDSRGCRMTRARLAEAIDVTDGAICRWEQGNRLPKWENLVAIARVLGLSAAEERDLFWAAGFKRPQEDAA